MARCHEEDVDGDGDTDLDCDSTDGTLTGQTFGGGDIEGTDTVRMIDEGGGQA